MAKASFLWGRWGFCLSARTPATETRQIKPPGSVFWFGDARKVWLDRSDAPGAKERADSGQFQRIRSEVPPSGRAMTFPEWSEAIVAGVRRYLPDARAVRKGHRRVIIRHGDREAQLDDDGGAFCIRFRAGDSATTMSGLVDRDRRDSTRRRRWLTPSRDFSTQGLRARKGEREDRPSFRFWYR
jgi:hypothetical protein